MQTRRHALLTFGALVGGIAGGLSLPAAALAQGAVTLGWSPKGLSVAQAQVLDAVAELIVPKTDTPGAREAGVPAYVDRTVAGWSTPAEAAEIRAALDRLDADARAAHGKGFASLSGEQQMAVATRHDTAPRPNPFARLKELVFVGYFTSEPGATLAVRYDPIPGDYKGCIPLKDVGRAWAT
jgi:hypothetical protein